MKKLLTTTLILALIFPSIFSQDFFNASSTWQEDYFAANIPTIITEKYQHLVD
ncbi:MAG: branched-subunit amino acid transport protein [Maribacter sp.]|jgi:branched-subunit amino acid transport protein